VEKERLRNKTLFVGLTDEQLDRIIECSNEVRIEKGETIVQQNEPGDTLFVIMDGKVEITHDTRKDGVLAQLSSSEAPVYQYKGDFFGEMALLDTEPRSATVIAIENCTLLSLNRNDLGELFAEDPSIHIVIIGNIARVLSRRLRTAIHHVDGT